jgi:hypothetical protein
MKIDERIPSGIADYIEQNFRDEFLFEVKNISKKDTHTTYTVEVSKDNYIHILKFDENGVLLKEDANEAFPSDIHEEQSFGEVPE